MCPMAPRPVSSMSFIEEEVCGKDIHISIKIYIYKDIHIKYIYVSKTCVFHYTYVRKNTFFCEKDKCVIENMYLFHRRMCSFSQTCVLRVYTVSRSLFERCIYVCIYMSHTVSGSLFVARVPQGIHCVTQSI